MAKNEAQPPIKTPAQQAQEPQPDQPQTAAQPSFSDSDHPLRAPEAPVQIHQGPGVVETPPDDDVPFDEVDGVDDNVVRPADLDDDEVI